MVKTLISAKKLISNFTHIAVLYFVFTYLLAMTLGIFLMLFSPEGSQFSQTSIQSLPLGFLVLFVISIPMSTTFGTVFVVIWAIYVLCFALAWRTNEKFTTFLRGNLFRYSPTVRANFLYFLPAISSSLLMSVLLMQGFQEAAGLPTGSIEFKDSFRGLFELTYSPIFEEIMFRISPYAVYAAVIISSNIYAKDGLRLKMILKSFLLLVAFPDTTKEKLGLSNVRKDGVKIGISLSEWILVILTSTIFGLAHYLSGSGWELGKASSSFLAGLVFFLAYLIFGFQAPILLHWFFNYYFYVYEIAAENYHGFYVTLENIIGFSAEIAGSLIILTILLSLLWKIFQKGTSI